MTLKSNRPHLSVLETGWDKFWKTFWNGSKPCVNNDFCITGRITPTLRRKLTININLIIDGHGKFKLGKTGDSYIRCDKNDYRDGYDHMYLLYKSTSKDYVSQLEEEYIAKYLLSHPEKIKNLRVKAPGKKMFSYDGYYYLYIVTS